MSMLKAQILADVKDAMRAKEAQKLGTLRMVTAAIKQIEVDERRELSEDDVLAILTKLVKQRRESIDQFSKANRQDLVDIEEAELAIISKYLPEPLSEAEVNEIIKAAIKESGAVDMKDMGKVMALAKPQLQSRTDMGKVSGLIKALLS